MRIDINQAFTEAGCSYPLTGICVGWLCSEMGKRIRPSKSFLQQYSKAHSFCIFLDASSSVAKPVIHGPRVNHRAKEVQFTIILPCPGGPGATKHSDASAYAPVVKMYLDTMVETLRKVEIDPSRIVRDTPDIIQRFRSKPKMIRSHDWG